MWQRKKKRKLLGEEKMSNAAARKRTSTDIRNSEKDEASEAWGNLAKEFDIHVIEARYRKGETCNNMAKHWGGFGKKDRPEISGIFYKMDSNQIWNFKTTCHHMLKELRKLGPDEKIDRKDVKAIYDNAIIQTAARKGSNVSSVAHLVLKKALKIHSNGKRIDKVKRHSLLR